MPYAILPPYPYGSPYASPYGSPYGAPPAYGAPYGAPAYGMPGAYAPYGYAATNYGYVPAVGFPFIPKQPGVDTFDGLRFLRYACYGVLFFNLLSLFSNLVLVSAVGQMDAALRSGSLSQLTAVDRTIAASDALFVIALLIGLASVLVGYGGMVKLSSGRSTFGARHKLAVGRGVGLAAGSSLAYVFLGLLNLASNSGIEAQLASLDLADFNTALSMMYSSAVITSFVALLCALLAGLALFSFAQELMTERGRKVTKLFLVLSMAGPVLNIAVAFALPAIVGPVNLHNGSSQAELQAALAGILRAMWWLAVVPAVGNFLTMLALFLFLRMASDAEQSARNIVKTGLSDPDAAMRQAIGWSAPSLPPPTTLTYSTGPPPP